LHFTMGDTMQLTVQKGGQKLGITLKAVGVSTRIGTVKPGALSRDHPPLLPLPAARGTHVGFDSRRRLRARDRTRTPVCAGGKQGALLPLPGARGPRRALEHGVPCGTRDAVPRQYAAN